MAGRLEHHAETPIAFETQFGWILAGNTQTQEPVHHAAVHHVLEMTSSVVFGRRKRVQRLAVH